MFFVYIWIFFAIMEKLSGVEVMNMADKQNKASQTNAQKVRKQNQAAVQGQDAEFASETDAQEVRKQNQQAEQQKPKKQQ